MSTALCCVLGGCTAGAALHRGGATSGGGSRQAIRPAKGLGFGLEIRHHGAGKGRFRLRAEAADAADAGGNSASGSPAS